MDRREFSEQFFNAVNASGLSVNEVAGELRTSGAVVAGWMTGRAPHRVARRGTLDAMLALVKRED